LEDSEHQELDPVQSVHVITMAGMLPGKELTQNTEDWWLKVAGSSRKAQFSLTLLTF
jgi:hypothetical protein